MGVWFGIAKGKILSYLTELPARHKSVFSFPDDNSISWRSNLGLLMGKLRQFLTSYLPTTRPYFRFRASKYQWVSPLGMCIDIVEIRFGIANRQISAIFDRVVCPPHDSGGVLSFHVLFFHYGNTPIQIY